MSTETLGPGRSVGQSTRFLEVEITCQKSINVRKGIGDPAVEKRFMGLNSKTAAVHLGEFVERDGLYIHHRRDGAQVTITVMSGEEFAALRAGFDEAVETVLRDNAMAASADTYRTLLEAKDDALDPLPCPTCGRDEAPWTKAPKDLHHPSGRGAGRDPCRLGGDGQPTGGATG